MKTSAVKHFTKTIAATMSAVFAFTLIPMALGQNAVIAAEEITKTQENTFLGVSEIKGPSKPNDNGWNGSYVYYGGNYGIGIKFRVLDPNSDKYVDGGNTLFLDSDKTLFKRPFSPGQYDWKNSELRSFLNSSFLGFYFTSLEQDAIAPSTVDVLGRPFQQGTGVYMAGNYDKYVGLNQDRIFVLDAEEASNPAYGYSNTLDASSDRMKGDNWWLRTTISTCSDVGVVSYQGFLMSDQGDDENTYVAPALNINQSSIIFSTKIKDLGNDFGEYKLTLLDDKLEIAVPDGQQLAVSGTTVTVPYLISGDHAANATRASILILDENNKNIEFYAALEGIFSNSAATTGSFTFPDSLDLGDWGTKYHVYILAEDINGTYETDYASDKVCIDSLAPTTFKVTYKVVNGTWSDGTTTDLTVSVAEGSAPIRIPTSMIASFGYEGGSWNTDPSKATISADTTFTYSFKEIPKYTVTYKVVNGTWSDGTTGIKTETVMRDSSPTSIPDGMLASSGYEGGAWDIEPSSATITGATTFTYTFKAIPPYTVTVQNDGNGTATADVTSGPAGTEVTLTATPSTGYQFKEWQVVSGGVTVTDNKFTIGTSDVTVKAVFEAKPADPVEPTTADPVTVEEPAKSTGPYTYTVVSGGDSTWTEGDLVIRVKSGDDDEHCIDRYEYTAIDGTKLTDEQAPATSGSTVITIKSDLLKTLSEGKHTILVNFSDNSITTTVTIVKKAAGTSNVPSTGEVIGVSAIAGTVLILSACSILIVMRTKKREEEQ